ncbi:MAG: UDP-N-acetylmuramate dehydrogenase [Vicinamibacterales bacterium]
MTGFERALRETFGEQGVTTGAPLVSFTTLRVGGPADWLVTVRSASEAVQLVLLARDHCVPLTVLGGGSNLLVSDRGVRGVVMRVHGGDVTTIGDGLIRADAGVTINGLVRWTINRGVSGLEAWAGTPGTVGGAIHGNAHFRGRLIGEVVAHVTVVTPSGQVQDVDGAAMQFAYDYSRIHRTGEVVVAADFRVGAGEPLQLRRVARESLAFRKRTQPLESASAGCMFQNPNPRTDVVPAGIPASAGALVDRAGLKGAQVGGAHVSSRHANFIVNDGTATADDIITLVDRCKREVQDRFGVTLREEVIRVGFMSPDRL